MVPTLTEKQMESLSDPLRWKIVMALRSHGERRARELAADVGSPVSTLYYALKILVESGLVLSNPTESGQSYQLFSPRFQLNSAAPEHVRAKLADTMLKAVAKELAETRANDNSSAHIVRGSFWLAEIDSSEFQTRIDALAREIAAKSHAGEGQLVHWTSIVTRHAPS